MSETEDIITRNKALERGDKLMSLFWSAVNKDGPPTAATSTGANGAKVTTALATRFGNSKRKSIAARNNSVVKATTAEDDKNNSQQGPGIGGKLSSEIAGKCLGLLAEAKEAYEGQGFGQQADSAARWEGKGRCRKAG